ncbi:hypothetical protein SASPL_144216 [Salvia splendens]|uniref:Ubiquitin-like protease family profile domain-containing protein n=1 Tax=Salvia splendens TaxID=180675 RepID=A0A8X8WLN8_SALSN|nr:hypothetical protein SASPL_144216 [Salvia splendens]
MLRKKQKKSIENEKQSQNAENVSQRLLVKRKPLFFVDAISQLNEAQINYVKEIGFEDVLHYRIEYIPSRLAFSLLKSFDEEKCKIKLYNGKKIHIMEEDVELVYGFPRGNITYCREKWKSNAPFMWELAEQCDTKQGNVNHKAVEQLMLADKEGGPQFKRLFLVLFQSALIEPSTCGMIKTKIGEIIDDLDNVRNINWCSYTISVLKFAMGNWSKTEKNAFAGTLPFLMNLLPKNFIQEEQQQGNEEKSVDVNESGVGSSSQNILPSHMVANIENNDLFGLICDIARSAIGSQKSPVVSVSDIFLHLSQSYNIHNDVAVDNWKALFDSIRNAEKANETIEDLNEFPTFRLDDFFDKAVEQRNKDNLPTSPVGDPEEVRQTIEEDEQRKENMICDDHNESNSPISTAVLGSPRTASPYLQQQEVNASEHDNTLASLIGSENKGNELEIQEEVEADRELRTQDALHILSKVCGDCEISNNEKAIKATNTIVDIINEQEDREDAAACSIVEYMMQEGIETMDDTPPEWNVQKQGYKGKETMHEEKQKTPENAERRMTVYQVFFPVFTSGYYYLVVFWMKINKIEIIDSVKPPKAKDPLEKYTLHKGKGIEYWLFSTWNKDSTDTQRKILRSDAYIKEQQEVYGYENRKISKQKRSTSVSQKELMNVEKKQKKSTENEKQSQNAENVSQRLLVKRKPLFFVDAISQFNEARINFVKEMGFESVLHYRFDYIPRRLAFSLLKSFDEEKCKIKLCNGKNIHITEENVELVYGFPREQCDTKPTNVNHKAVEQLMLPDQEGGPQFKRLFCVLLESSLIEPSICEMIKSKIGEIVDDLDNVRNINWCSYTISVLKFAMENWSKTEKNDFAGPLPFLMITPDSGVGSSHNLKIPKHFIKNVVTNILDMNREKINLVKTLKEAPQHIKTNYLFGMLCDMARSSVGSQTTTIEAVNEKCQLLSKMFEEDKPETFDRWKTISESILLAQKEKEALEDLAEFPTFKTPRFLDKYAEQGNRENIPTSPVSDPKRAAEEGEGTKEDTVVDDNNESASLILPPAAGPTDDAYVFFPVCANFHYYLVVYWMKKNTIEIIDNNKPHKAMDPFEKYDIDIGLMKDMFEAYFIEKKMLDNSENVNKSSINFLPLEWAISTNNKDCGVYLMRHMETYVGKKGSEWDIGFFGRSVKIPQILRGRYCYRMISSIYNNQRSPMLQLAHDWMEANIEKLLELNNKYKELFSRRKK